MLHAKSSAFGAAKIAATSTIDWTKLKHGHRADRLKLRRLDKLRCQRKCVYGFRYPFDPICFQFGLFVQKLRIWFRTWNLSRLRTSRMAPCYNSFTRDEIPAQNKEPSSSMHGSKSNKVIVNNSAVFVEATYWESLWLTSGLVFSFDSWFKGRQNQVSVPLRNPGYNEAKTLLVHFHQGTPASLPSLLSLLGDCCLRVIALPVLSFKR